MSVKLLMCWDIKPGLDQDYFEFMVREWLPGVNSLGIQTTWAWYTIYSNNNAPQIMAEAIADDLPIMRDVLKSTDWSGLQERLLEYVDNYEHKVIHVTGGFQL